MPQLALFNEAVAMASRSTLILRSWIWICRFSFVFVKWKKKIIKYNYLFGKPGGTRYLAPLATRHARAEVASVEALEAWVKSLPGVLMREIGVGFELCELEHA